jgi:hypothetical protein
MMASPPAAQPDLFYPAPPDEAGLNGLPHLMELAFRGQSLEPLGQTLIERARINPTDANALMDLSCIMQLGGNAELAQRMQADALAVSRCYSLPATGAERLRVLSIMVPGALMDNMPIEFLLQGSDLALDMLYMRLDDNQLHIELPPHDVACIGVCESLAAQPVLDALSRALPDLPRPVLNDPARIMRVARPQAWRLLQDVPGCLMPPSAAVDRAWLQALACGDVRLSDVLPGASFPIICRPNGSHAGQGLDKIADAAALAQHLGSAQGDAFVISPFVDYISADGQYRKFRIAFVGGQPYPVHMALSARWMVHYLNGDMADRPDNRAEEQRFFDEFDRAFAWRHAAALAALDERVGLDYYSIDCGETADGRLLVFEIDTGGVAHAMDPLEGYGYKRPHMLKLFAAFQTLLKRAAIDPACLKPKLQAA